MKIKEKSKGIKKAAESINGLIADDYDAVIVISGIEGEGKSTLAIRLAYAIDPVNFNLKDGIIYSSDTNEITQHMTNKSTKVFIVDEAIRHIYKLNYMRTEQRILSTLFSVARKNNKICILCIPNFHDMNTYFRKHRCRVWFYVPKRGFAVVFKRAKAAFATKDVWFMDDNWKIEGKYIREKRNTALAYEQMINYIGRFRFNKLPKDVEEEYRRLSTLHISDLNDDNTLGIRDDMWKTRFVNLSTTILLNKLTTRREIVKFAGIPQASLEGILSREVKNKLKEYRDSKISNKHTHISTLPNPKFSFKSSKKADKLTG